MANVKKSVQTTAQNETNIVKAKDGQAEDEMAATAMQIRGGDADSVRLAIATLPQIDKESRQLIIKNIDEEDKRVHDYHVQKNKRFHGTFRLSVIFVCVIIAFMIYRTDNIPWGDILSTAGYIAGGLFGGGTFVFLKLMRNR